MSTLTTIPRVRIRRRYYLYLFLINLLSVFLHEFGHALAIIIKGGKILSYQLITVIAEPRFYDDSFLLLGGPLLTSIICFFATYKIFVDRKNSEIWLATMFSNFRPLVSLILYIISDQQDESYVLITQLKIPPLISFSLLFLIFSLPLLVLIKAPELPPDKKIIFYLNNIAIILPEILFLNILNRIIFR